MDSAITSENMCAASASRASDPKSHPPAISTSRKAPLAAREMVSALRCPSRTPLIPCAWWWSDTFVTASLRSRRRSGGDVLAAQVGTGLRLHALGEIRRPLALLLAPDAEHGRRGEQPREAEDEAAD